MAPSERFDKSALAARQALRTYGAHILSLSRSALVRCEEMLLLSSSSKDEACRVPVMLMQCRLRDFIAS